MGCGCSSSKKRKYSAAPQPLEAEQQAEAKIEDALSQRSLLEHGVDEEGSTPVKSGGGELQVREADLAENSPLEGLTDRQAEWTETALPTIDAEQSCELDEKGQGDQGKEQLDKITDLAMDGAELEKTSPSAEQDEEGELPKVTFGQQPFAGEAGQGYPSPKSLQGSLDVAMLPGNDAPTSEDVAALLRGLFGQSTPSASTVMPVPVDPVPQKEVHALRSAKDVHAVRGPRGRSSSSTSPATSVAPAACKNAYIARDNSVVDKSVYSHVQFIAYEICTRPRAPYDVVEADELQRLLSVVSEEGPPVITETLVLASGTIQEGSLVKALYCPKQRHWRNIESKAQLPTKGWFALRCCSGGGSAEARWKLDFSARLELLDAALKNALSLQSVDTSPSTLKVFMAPEFLLRGPAGACTREEVLGDPCDSKSLVAQLQMLVSGPRWAHWQCLFGTVLGCADGDSGEAGAETYNMAIMQKGGFQTAEEKVQHCCTFLKRSQNGVDFLQRGVDLETRAIAEMAGSKSPVRGSPVRGSPLRGSPPSASPHQDTAESMVNVMRGAMARADAFEKMTPSKSRNSKTVEDEVDEIIVEMSGCSWGVEVCLDHSMARLRKELKGHPKRLGLDLQLVTSCGMDVKNGSVAVKQGGLVFHCDGLHGTGYGAHSSAFVWGHRGPQMTIPVRASVQAHGEDWREQMVAEGLGTLYSTSFPADVAGPMLRVYDPVPVPSSTEAEK